MSHRKHSSAAKRKIFKEIRFLNFNISNNASRLSLSQLATDTPLAVIVLGLSTHESTHSNVHLVPLRAELAAFSEARLPTRRLAKNGRARSAQHHRLAVAEDRRNREAARLIFKARIRQ